MKLITSQIFLNLRRTMVKTGLDKKHREVEVVSGTIDGEPTYAVYEGHHALMACRLNCEDPTFKIYKEFEDENDFRNWLGEHEVHGDWWDLDSGEYVESLHRPVRTERTYLRP